MKNERPDPYRRIASSQKFGGWGDPRDIQFCLWFFDQRTFHLSSSLSNSYDFNTDNHTNKTSL